MVHLSKTELEDVIKILPSHGFYESFDKDEKGSEHSSECNKLSTNDDRIKNICLKFLKNLKDLSNMKNEKKKNDDNYRYLTFWIYDKLYNMFGKHFTEILEIGNNYYKSLSNQLYLNEYGYDFNRIREMKYLYDYFKRYEVIIKCKKSPEVECNKYNKYCRSWKKKNKYTSYENPRDNILDSHPEPMLQNMNGKIIQLAFQE
ncbi:CYIR protein [Plasmodium cynomolgi strain B]|uniref:CYIR protein n=1 Tax=Plasmodium cynomolgi (strain B) TaxID=1120755 RepID=K6UNF0_PLACD|nr:CYIR protein [Plasmodium cynomolgi strain B]GAB69428.1 CYIR protein [Plasmodium cynomolgi strain B]